jgi:hypothetical protein
MQGLAGQFDETDHMRGVIPGRHRKVASPESITLGQWLWIPGSRKSAPRNDAAYNSKFKNVELAERSRVECGEAAHVGGCGMAASSSRP